MGKLRIALECHISMRTKLKQSKEANTNEGIANTAKENSLSRRPINNFEALNGVRFSLSTWWSRMPNCAKV